MKISADTIKVIEFLEFSSGKPVKQKDKLAFLLELCAENGLDESMNELIFKGSALFKLSEIIKNNMDEPEQSGQAKKEIINLSTELLNIINDIKSHADEETTEIINSSYFSNTPEALEKPLGLGESLAAFKKIQTAFRNRDFEK